MKFIIITGVSGAGKSSAAKYMEDIGYFCVDNLPPSLIPKFAEICIKVKGKIKKNKVALVIDIRGEEFLDDLFPALDTLSDFSIPYEIVFLDASDDVLIKRFKETSRSHPLAPEGRIIEGIIKEREKLKEIRAKAKKIIDTSNIRPQQLREEIREVSSEGEKKKRFVITVSSFGFKYGIPIDSDLVFDVRFIPNPFYIEELKYQTGLDEDVKQYVINKQETQTFINKAVDMLGFLIPNYMKGKNQLFIGIGCTGGQHRSVAITERLGEILSENSRVIIEHRDVEKANRRKNK
jgi:RNase adapter protein RapZ